MQPIIPDGYVLLAEVFQRFGKQRFGDEWTGKELDAYAPSFDPTSQREITERCAVVEREVRAALYNKRPEASLLHWSDGEVGVLPPQFFNAGDIEISFLDSVMRMELWSPELGSVPPIPGSGIVIVKEDDLSAVLHKPRKPKANDRLLQDGNLVGRPAAPREMIEEEYRLLLNAGEIDFSAPMARLYPIIRDRVAEKRHGDKHGLGKQVICATIRPLFQRDRP